MTLLLAKLPEAMLFLILLYMYYQLILSFQRDTAKAPTTDTEEVLLAELSAFRQLDETDAGRQIAPSLL